MELVAIRNQRHNQLNQNFLFKRIALSNKQRNCCQAIVIDFQFTRFLETMFVLFQKSNKEKCTDTFVAISERMVLDDEVEQVSGLFFDACVNVFAIEGLYNAFQ